MDINLNFGTVKTSSKFRERGDLSKAEGELVVWWYGGIIKNDSDSSQPIVRVGFRRLIGRKKVSDKFFWFSIALEHLGFFRIGSVWRSGRLVRKIEWKEAIFDISTQQGDWVTQAFRWPDKKGNKFPFPPQIHHPEHIDDISFFIKFFMSSGQTLVVPCIEYFNQCYGNSSKIRQVLVNYSKSKWQKELFSDVGESDSDSGFFVRLRPGLTKYDVNFLAHVKHERQAKYATKYINSVIESKYSEYGNRPMYIRIFPWFQGTGKLKVEGIPFDNGRSFLGLRITGASEPNDKPIEYCIDGQGDINATTGLSSANGSCLNHNIHAGDTISHIDVTPIESPDNDTASIEVYDGEFELLGEPPKLIRKPDRNAMSRKTRRLVNQVDPDLYSTGNPSGTGGGVGQIKFRTQVILDSKGMLRDFWNALVSFVEDPTSSIYSVEWYVPNRGFQSSTNPQLMAFQPIDFERWSTGKPVTRADRNWVYLDPLESNRQQRGLLVTRLRSPYGDIYFLDVQRRPSTMDGEHGAAGSSDKFLIFVFLLKSGTTNFRLLITELCSLIRNSKGDMNYVATQYDGECTAIKHSSSKSDSVSMQSAVRNGITQLGMKRMLEL